METGIMSAFSLDNGTVIAYFDGIETGNTTYNHGTGFGNAVNLGFPGSNSGDTYSYDDVRIYSRALSRH